MSHSHTHKPGRPGERIVVRSMDEVPDFADECEEADYWSTHELAPELFEPGPLDPAEEAALARARQRRASARWVG